MRFTACLILCSTMTSVSAEQVCDTKDFPLSLPSERFVAQEDGAVSDTSTELMWQRCALGQKWTGSSCEGDPRSMTWSDAQRAAAAVNEDGTYFFNDWRVPSVRDLASIIERQCTQPRTNIEVFPATPADFFWTSTRRSGADADSGAYALSFGPEGVEHHSQGDKHHVRLVRPAI
jgi:hypothetical protein